MAASVHADAEKCILAQHGSAKTDRPHHEPVQISQMHRQTVGAAKDVVCGSVAGILAKYVEYPFDTVKVRLQSQSNRTLGDGRLRGPLDAFAEAWRAPEGPWKNLYRGISAPLLGAAIETSSLFFSYRIAQDLLVTAVPSLREYSGDSGDNGRTNLPLPALLICGATSGAFTSLLLTPIELIKCKMQVPLSPGSSPPAPRTDAKPPRGLLKSRSPSPLELIVDVFKSQGLRGFWHGQLGTLIRETGGSAAWFGSYEGVKMLFERQSRDRITSSPSAPGNATTTTHPLSTTTSPSLLVQLLAGAMAGISYNFFFYPADTIKSRMQTEHANSSSSSSSSHGHNKSTFLTTARQLYRESGLGGFYRGCGITVARSAPSSAIIFGIYEWLRWTVEF